MVKGIKYVLFYIVFEKKLDDEILEISNYFVIKYSENVCF